MYEEFEELDPSYKPDKKSQILSDLDDIIEYEEPVETPRKKKQPTNSPLPSSFLKKKEKKEEEEMSSDEWMATLLNLRAEKPKKRRGRGIFDMDDEGGKKKKKKKHKDDKTIDYKKEFEQEMALYRNLLIDQNKFTDSLQKEYDAISSRKSSARGTSKAITDLVQNITSARQLSMQLVEKNVNIKKTIADLNMKERKENKEQNGDNSMSDFASSYLRQIVNERQSIVNPQVAGDTEIVDFSEDQISNFLSDSLSDVDRSEEVDLYLKYENQNVKIYVVMNPNDSEDYYFLAKDENGVEIEDYPLPDHTKMSINRSTEIATDVYGEKYHIIWK